MAFLGSVCALVVFAALSFVAWRALRFKGRRVHFRCSSCGAQETHFERQLDVRSLVTPTCRCGGTQTFTVEGTDTTADIETFGRNPAEAGSLVVCTCGNRGVISGECDLIVFGGATESHVHQRPVACPRCGVQFVMRRPSSAPPTREEPAGQCACGVTPVPLKRGIVLRCPQCQQRQARVVLMS